MENSGEKINSNQESKKVYEYPVVCMYCKNTYEKKETDDAKMEGKPSHGICRECARKKCIEDAKERLSEGFEE
jgi:hypothetical protein